MQFVLVSALTMLFGGLAALCANRNRFLSNFAASGSVLIASVLGMTGLFPCLIAGKDSVFDFPSNIPFFSFNFYLDPLSAFFLLVILLIAPFVSLYGISYMKSSSRIRFALCHFFVNSLFSSMIFLLISANAFLFLFFWELMALSSFLLVLAEKTDEKSRKAAWTYFTATSLGTCFIIAFFALLFRGFQGMNFNFTPFATPEVSAGLFILALIGFGSKAGIVPFHVWLPEAHPAAPSHVSAAMSGIMIKMGVYGLIRCLLLIGQPPLWWGIVLVSLGAASAFFGVLYTVAQSELKRMLAYCSIENIGIIVMGLGIGFIGRSADSVSLQMLGFGGALLHVLNHAIFKSLLFFCAGSVLHSCGTLSMDELGGIQKKMPLTGTSFLIGSASICAIPPFNGFISEFLIYYGAFRGILSLNGLTEKFFCVLVFATLCVSGALALAAFSKAYGAVFLGEARKKSPEPCHEADVFMRTPMISTAFLCILIGLLSPYLTLILYFPLNVMGSGADLAPLLNIAEAFKAISTIFSSLLLLFSFLIVLRTKILPLSKETSESLTWDCGYAKPTARMQYTASSFVKPITDFFRDLLCVKEDSALPKVFFPKNTFYQTRIREFFRIGLYDPAFKLIERISMGMRVIQHGNLQLYVMYIAATLVALILWKVFFA